MSKIESFVQWAENIANDDSHGYSQGGREGQDFDCSSLVCRALRAAGFNAPYPSFSTRSMGTWLEQNGWVWRSGLNGVHRGCILWKTGHTAIAVSESRLVEACIDERGQITGGRPGDQTGNEIRFARISTYNWAGYWESEEEEMNNTEKEQLKTIYQQVTTKFDPTGRNIAMNDHDHIKWIAAGQVKQNERLDEIESKLDSIIKSINDLIK